MSRKIFILKTSLYQKGGAEKYALRLANALKDQGDEVTILTSGPALNVPDIRTINLPHTPSLSFKHLGAFDKWSQEKIKTLNPDIVFSLDRNSRQDYLRASNGVHKAYLKKRSEEEGYLKQLSFLFNPLHKRILDLEKRGFESLETKKIFTNSHMVKEEILHSYNIPKEKVLVVHNGVEWHEMEEDFHFSLDKREELCETFQLNPSNHLFLFVGNNYNRKGLPFILSNLAKMADAPFHLLVVGKDKRLEQFKQTAQALNLTKKVSFYGPQPNIRLFYQLADTLLVPSIYDPFANVTLEGLSMGLRVITSKNNGANEILTPQNGSIIQNLKNDEEVYLSLKNALNYHKTKDSALKQRMSVQHLSFNNQLKKIIQHLI
ncbi:MAG: glycosyltransferase family 4 protein [Rhabdochlamydiaceae bacterium]